MSQISRTWYWAKDPMKLRLLLLFETPVAVNVLDVFTPTCLHCSIFSSIFCLQVIDVLLMQS
jgi:hypothetical protein